MVHSFEVNDVLYELCDHVVSILGATGAGVSVVLEDRLQFVTATSERVIDVERAQEAHQDGPCTTAYSTGDVVAVPELAEVSDWPEYRAAAAAAGIVSVVGIPLTIDHHRVGSLDVYDTTRREWTDEELDAARVLADIATAYLVRAGELAESRQLSEQLQTALDSRIIIEQAKGALARDLGTTVDDAFEVMRRHARRTGASIRLVADGIVNLGLEIPTDD
ncbi:MAG: GAF and ANTAR domain-containing protein [Acidimicrobiales bacterium]